MNTRNDILDCVYNLIETHEGRSFQDYSEQYNFVREGFLDSFALLSFFTDVEEMFSIHLSPEELSSTDIQSIAGLVELVIYKQKEQNL